MRDLRQLDGEFDVLIIGAGIHGATLAWTCAARGLRVALVDAGDFGGAASANSLKIVHGGLRYLQHANLARMRESIRARRRFLQLAPGLVRPLPCLMPTRGSGARSRAALGLALLLNGWISADRNRGLGAARALPAGGLLSLDELRAAVPRAHFAGVDGAARWWDALAENTDRLNLEFVLAARRRGAVVRNYIRAERLVVRDGAVAGAELQDLESGAAIVARARAVVVAAGPGLRALLPPQAAGAFPDDWVKAWNLIVRPRLLEQDALAIECAEEYRDPDAVIRRGRRNLFLVPWRGGTMIGTLYQPHVPGRDAGRVTAEDAKRLLDLVNRAKLFPWLEPADIAFAHCGILPAGGPGRADAAKETRLLDGTAAGLRGLLVVQGVKYTTALEIAERAADRVQRALGRPAARAPGEALADVRAGSASALDAAGLRAEVGRVIGEELAVRLSDVVLRRTDLGSFQHPGRLALELCADEMAARLGWSAARRADEIAAVEDCYRLSAPQS